MVNKPFWHIIDFVLASYTFGCVKMSYFVPNNRHLRQVLLRLSQALREKRPQFEQRHEKVILQHDNARLHVAKLVKPYLETLKWEVSPHPPYSPDIVPSDCYLFRSMAHGLADQQFRWLKTSQNGFIRG